jgi:S-formylglutathione hydrolase FrmB
VPVFSGNVSRRTVLLGSLAAAAVTCAGGYELIQDGTLPGKYTLARLDGSCGSPPPRPGGPPPRRSVTRFWSAYRGREVTMVTLVPASAPSERGLPLVIALHGAGSDARSMADLVAPAMTSASVAGLAIVCPDGGDTYWHPRADGDNPLAMIVDEVLPRAAASAMATRRIGITGLSMGGYGALLLAERLAARPVVRSFAGMGAAADESVSRAPLQSVAAVAALSPAIFGSYAEAIAASHGSFDSRADFDGNDVITGLRSLRRVPTWIACGSDDPFQPETALVLSRLRVLTGQPVPGGIMAGCHDDAFWGRNMPAALSFLAAHLT